MSESPLCIFNPTFKRPLFLRANCCTHLLPILYYSLLFIHTLYICTSLGETSNNSLSSLLYSHGSGAHLKTERSVLFNMTVWVCKAGWQWHLALQHRCLYLDSLLTAKWLWQQHPPTLMAQTHWETDDIFSRSFECVAKEDIVYTKIIRYITLLWKKKLFMIIHFNSTLFHMLAGSCELCTRH